MLATKKPSASISPYNRALLDQADMLAGSNGHAHSNGAPSPQTSAPVATIPKRRGRPPKHPRPETGAAASEQPQTGKAAEPKPAPEPGKNGVYLPPPHQKPAAPIKPADIAIHTGPAPEFRRKPSDAGPRQIYFDAMAELKPGQWFAAPGSEKLNTRDRANLARALRTRIRIKKLAGVKVGISADSGGVVVKRDPAP